MSLSPTSLVVMEKQLVTTFISEEREIIFFSRKKPRVSIKSFFVPTKLFHFFQSENRRRALNCI